MTPGWTTATRFSRSISRIRSIAVKAMVRPPSMPAAPPDRPVPAPRGTIGTRCSRGDPDELGDLGGRRREGDGAAAGRRGGRPSRRRGSTRGRAGRSAAGGPGRRPRSRSPVDRRRPCRRWLDGAWSRAGVYAARPSAELAGVAGRHGRRTVRPDPAGRRGTMAPMPGERRSSGRDPRGRRVRPRPPRSCRRRPPSRRRPSLASGAPRRRAAGPADRRRGRHRPGLGRPLEPRPRRHLRRLPQAHLGSRPLWVDSTATIRNTSGGPIDRVELNTIAARLGSIELQPVTVDGATVAGHGQRPDDRRAARRHPAGRRRRRRSGSASRRACGAA